MDLRISFQNHTQINPYNSGPFPMDNSERLLHREGVIDEIPASLCTNAANGKNVMLVVGDGMVSPVILLRLHVLPVATVTQIFNSRDGK